MKHLRLGFALLLVMGSALLFACGSDSDGDDSDSDEPTATQTAGEAEPTDESGDPTTDGGTSGDANSELQGLASSLAETPAHVTYNFTAEAGGQSSTGEFTLFWQPPDQWRLDIAAEGSLAVSYINSEGKTYLCSESSCFESPVQVPFPFIGYFTNPDSLNDLVDSEIAGVDFEQSEDTIAGQSVSCFTSSFDTGDVSAEYCFNDDGVLMRLDGGASGATYTLEATMAEATVSATDFDLPFPPQDIPGL